MNIRVGGGNDATASTPTLGGLRALIPAGTLTLNQALRVVERQAAALRGNVATTSDVVRVLLELPHVRVVYDHMPVNSLSYWNGHSWIVALNGRYPVPKLRYQLASEVGCILWHDHVAAQPDWLHHLGEAFAHHLLIPAGAVHGLWRSGQHDLAALATHFTVTEPTMLLRLLQLRPWLPEHHRRTDWAELVSTEVHYAQLLAHWTHGNDFELAPATVSERGGVAK